MPTIKITNLTFAYPGSYDPVFENTSVQLDTNWRLGLVGRNGRGKTTLLRLLLGEFAYSGRIDAPVPFCYFPFPVEDAARPALSVMLEVCPQAQEWELEREAGLLGLSGDALTRPFETLSNGQRTKALLASLFCREGEFLLLDEPTNHLDLESRAMLGNYLSLKSGFILVSHDRTLLDICTDHTLSINRAGLELVQGNFTCWEENRKRQDLFEQGENAKLKKEMRRLDAASKRTAGWADTVESTKYANRNSGLRPDRGFVGHKSAKMMKRAKATEQRRERAVEEKSKLLKNIEEADALWVTPLPFHKQRLVDARDVTLHYGSVCACREISFELKQGERLALRGPNGSGKSTLLKAILQDPAITATGRLELASGLMISYVPQDASGLRGDLKEFAKQQGADETRLLMLLRKLGFERVQFEKDMGQYSLGQKKKVLLAISLFTNAHLYIWDEPLNYVDVLSRMQIEALILRSSPTMLLVEHDAAFLENVATGELWM